MATVRDTQDVLELATTQVGTAQITQNAIEFLVGAGISCGNPPIAHVGEAYSHTLLFGGGTPPYTFAITAGALPPGLVLNSSTGVISGVANLKGTYGFTVAITDLVGTTSSTDCSITVLVVQNTPNAITGGRPFAAPGCKKRNHYDWCAFAEMLRYRKIHFPPSCTIPREFLDCYPLPWDEDFGANAIPFQAVPFKPFGGILTPAPAAGDQLVVSLRVPVGYDGLMQGVYWSYSGTGLVEGSGDIVWRLQVNQRFVEDLGNVPFQLGSSISPMPLTQGQILLSGQTVRVLVNVPNLSGMIQVGASRISAGMIGFYCPR